jgi:transporter family protein
MKVFEDWKVFAFGSAVFAGMTAVLAKVGVKNIPSNLATLIRTCVIIIFLGLLVGVRKEWLNPFSLNKRSLLFLALSGITTGLSWLCYYRALQTGPASIVAPIDKLSLVLAILFAMLFLGERLNAYQSIGASFVVVGVLLIALK